MIQTENYPWGPINLIVFYKPILTAISYKPPPKKKEHHLVSTKSM